MDVEISFVNTAVVLGATVFGWLIRTLWNATEDLKNDLTKLKEELPVKFVLKDDYKDDIKEIKDLLKALAKEIQTKEDKYQR